MRWRAFILLLGGSLLLLAPVTRADDLTGANRLICAAAKATECYLDGTCAQGEPEDWNVPRFMRVDLENKTLSTTRASGEQRSTALHSLIREGDRVFAQGSQSGRAVSLVLNQKTGVVSAAIVLDEHVLTVFAHCTPLDPVD